MPTQKPRIIITVDPETKAVLDRLQRAANKPASRIIAEVVNEAVPLFKAMADAAEAEKLKTREALDTLAGALAEVQVGASQMSLEIHRARQAVKQADKKKKTAVKGGKKRATTP